MLILYLRVLEVFIPTYYFAIKLKNEIMPLLSGVYATAAWGRLLHLWRPVTNPAKRSLCENEGESSQAKVSCIFTCRRKF